MNKLKCIAGFTVAGVMALLVIVLFIMSFWLLNDALSREFPLNVFAGILSLALMILVPCSVIFMSEDAIKDLKELWKNWRKA